MIKENKEFILKIEVKPLYDVVRASKELLNEMVLNFDDTGLKILETDSAQVCLIDIFLNKDEFREYYIKNKQEIGINVKTLYDLLKNNKKENVKLTKDENKLYLEFSNGIKSELDILEIEKNKKEIPNIDFKTKIEIKSKRLKKILKHFYSNSERVVFKNTENEFKIYSENSNITLKDEVKINGNISESKYSTAYLKKFTKIIFSEKTLIEFSTDTPIKLKQKFGNSEINYLLAPRVEQ